MLRRRASKAMSSRASTATLRRGLTWLPALAGAARMARAGGERASDAIRIVAPRLLHAKLAAGAFLYLAQPRAPLIVIYIIVVEATRLRHTEQVHGSASPLFTAAAAGRFPFAAPGASSPSPPAVALGAAAAGAALPRGFAAGSGATAGAVTAAVSGLAAIESDAKPTVAGCDCGNESAGELSESAAGPAGAGDAAGTAAMPPRATGTESAADGLPPRRCNGASLRRTTLSSVPALLAAPVEYVVLVERAHVVEPRIVGKETPDGRYLRHGVERALRPLASTLSASCGSL